jgi:hypothetical protein
MPSPPPIPPLARRRRRRGLLAPFPATASAEGRLIKGGPSPARGEGEKYPAVAAGENVWVKISPPGEGTG